MDHRITPDYLLQNIELHETEETYGTSGWQYADAVVRLVPQFGSDILDYGAGKRTLGLALARDHAIQIKEYDPAIAEIAWSPLPASIVVVGDVMEHIEPACLGQVLYHIHSLTTGVAYFVIGTRPAGKKLPDGRNCHLIQKPAWWWANQLGLSGFSITAASTGKKREAIFTAVPR
jgi:hypothetical protein